MRYMYSVASLLDDERSEKGKQKKSAIIQDKAGKYLNILY